MQASSDCINTAESHFSGHLQSEMSWTWFHFLLVMKPWIFDIRGIWTYISKLCHIKIQGGSNMNGTDLCVNSIKSVPVIFEPPCN